MPRTPRLVGLSGALRQGSTNTALLHEAVRLFGPCDFTMADLRLPLYDADLEEAEGLPDPVRALCAQIREADALVISTPEYNGNLSGVLKNALDWISRDKPLPTMGKPVAILSAADGRAGGARAQYSLRLCLTAFRVRILPAAEVAIADSGNAFDAEGRLKDAVSLRLLGDLMQALRAEIAG